MEDIEDIPDRLWSLCWGKKDINFVLQRLHDWKGRKVAITKQLRELPQRTLARFFEFLEVINPERGSVNTEDIVDVESLVKQIQHVAKRRISDHIRNHERDVPPDIVTALVDIIAQLDAIAMKQMADPFWSREEEKRVAELSEKATNLPIRFSASLSSTSDVYRGWKPIGHDTVHENIGGGYNSATGKFTALRAGRYSFKVRLQAHEHGCFIHFLSSERKLNTGFHMWYRRGLEVNRAFKLQMKVGDVVAVFACGGQLIGRLNDSPTTFSGELLLEG